MNIKELARLGDVSTATISRVLKGELNVEKNTRDKVMALLAQVNFYADTKPKKKKLRNLYVVISPVEVSGRIYESHISFFSKMFSGIREALNSYWDESTGEPYLINVTYKHGELEKKLKEIEGLPYSGHIAAMFLINGREADEKAILKKPLNKRLFILNRLYKESDNPNISFVYFDNILVGDIAYEELHTKGHRQIGVVAGPQDYSFYRERVDAFITNRHAASIEIFTTAENSVASAVETAGAVVPLIKSGQITALFTCSELLLEGTLATLEREGIEVGKDVSLITSNDYFLAYQHVPAISVVRTPSYELGEISAMLAIKGIALEFPIKTDLCVGVKLVERESVLDISDG